jgi:hypothetical protein
MAKKSGRGSKKKAARRESIDTGTDKRYVRRDQDGQFEESDDMGASLTSDSRTAAKTASKRGMGDRGDRKASGGSRKRAGGARKSAGGSRKSAGGGRTSSGGARKSTRKAAAKKR